LLIFAYLGGMSIGAGYVPSGVVMLIAFAMPAGRRPRSSRSVVQH
jgi:hypothetical protein